MSEFSRGLGIVGGGVPVDGTYARQIFFPLTQEVIDFIDENGVDDMYSRGNGVNVDVEQYLKMLPEVEAEIFYMLYVKHKVQKDVAVLLHMSQPTVSYRYRRALDKLSYLLVLASVQLKVLINTIPQLNDKEKAVLEELFYYCNQEMVGVKHGVRQSSVKWIMVKAKRYVAKLELEEPEKWHRQYSLFMLLERNLRMRIFC